jgi:hypothetical protein
MSALLVVLLSNVALAQTPEEKGLELAIKSDKANAGFVGEKSEMELVLINAHGDKVTRKLLSRTQETEKDGDKSIVTFEWPADVKGTRMLTWTHKSADDDQWLFLPSIKRVKRINSSNKSGSFMGSEFAYEDLGSAEVEKYKFKFVKDDAVDGRKQWTVERVPVDERSGYSKQLMWLDHEYLQPVRIEYYDRKGELLKTADFKSYQKLKGFWRAGEIQMVNHQTQKKSNLTWKNREMGVKHADSEFRSENLER